MILNGVFFVLNTVTKDWTASDIHNNHGHLLAEYRPCQIPDIIVGGTEDEEKITLQIRKMQKVKLLKFEVRHKTSI